MDIAGKNVLVFGSGISGIGAAGLLEERGASVTLYDGNDKLDVEEIRGKMKDGAKTDIVLGEFPEELLGKLDPGDHQSRCADGSSDRESHAGIRYSGSRRD